MSILQCFIIGSFKYFSNINSCVIWEGKTDGLYYFVVSFFYVGYIYRDTLLTFTVYLENNLSFVKNYLWFRKHFNFGGAC